MRYFRRFGQWILRASLLFWGFGLTAEFVNGIGSCGILPNFSTTNSRGQPQLSSLDSQHIHKWLIVLVVGWGEGVGGITRTNVLESLNPKPLNPMVRLEALFNEDEARYVKQLYFKGSIRVTIKGSIRV